MDHVPPQCLFLPPRPSDLITVPSCQPCNDSFKKDDEYFRQVITAGIDPFRFPIALQTITRLAAPQKAGFRRKMVSDVNFQDGSLGVDRQRVDRVASRLIRGLLFHHTEKRMGAGTKIQVWYPCFDDPVPGDSDLQALLDLVKHERLRTIGDGVFSYRCITDGSDNQSGVWQMVFYERNEVVGVVFPYD
jgi:hypothetical protein